VEFLCDTAGNFRLKPELMLQPPVVLWPEVAINVVLPEDVLECFGLTRG
jgi:hypothetical protein